MQHYQQIMQWMKTEATNINFTPQREFYEQYRAHFGMHNALSPQRFGRFLKSQNIGRRSIQVGDKVMKTYDTSKNSRLVYTPQPTKQPCPHCEGQGYIYQITQNV